MSLKKAHLHSFILVQFRYSSCQRKFTPLQFQFTFHTHMLRTSNFFHKHIILVEHSWELIYIVHIPLMIEVHFADNICVLLVNIAAINETCGNKQSAVVLL